MSREKRKNKKGKGVGDKENIGKEKEYKATGGKSERMENGLFSETAFPATKKNGLGGKKRESEAESNVGHGAGDKEGA